MYMHDAGYDLSALLADNLHVHTAFSRCAGRNRTLAVILDEARDANLRSIAITDHYNDDIDDTVFGAHVARLRRQHSEIPTDVRVLIGCELSAYGVGKWLGGASLLEQLDYRLYACNHYHLDYWEHPDDRSPQGYAAHMVAVASSVIRSGHADCLAHPFGPGYIRTGTDQQRIVDALTENMLGDVFELAKRYETAIELNHPVCDPFGLQRKLFNLGREVGVVFNYGTDAHRDGEVNTMRDLAAVKKVLLG